MLATPLVVAPLFSELPKAVMGGRDHRGVAWLDWGKTGDGFSRPRGGLLVLRNMAPDPSFTQAPANVTVPGTEAQVMGDYLPSGTYTSRAAFERRALGCR